MIAALFNTSYILVLLIQSVDFFKSRTTFEGIFGISSNTILILFVFITLTLRFFSVSPFSPRIKFINQYILFPLFFFVGTLFTLIDAFTPANFVYSLTRFNYQEFIYLALATGILAITMQSDTIIRKHYRKIIFFLSLLLLAMFLLATTWPFNEYKEIVKEDRFVENLQFTTLFITGIISMLIAIKLFSKKKILGLLFWFIAIGFLVVAGDEVSWGQRILNIQTPEYLSEINQQQEITVHNIEGVQLFVGFGYMLISLYGISMWFIKDKIKKLQKSKYSYLFIPSPSLLLLFGFSFIYNFRTLFGNHNWGMWSEVAELFLYLALFLHLLICYYKVTYKSK